MPRLDGSWWKYARAHEQTGEFKGELESYLERQPVGLGQHDDPETGEHVIRFHVTERPKALWSVQLGEIIHDLHSALDHAVWQLVIDAGNTPQEFVTGFPIFTDKSKFDSARVSGWRMISGVPDGAGAAIERMQPYHATKQGVGPDHTALAVLREMWNIDKHRLLHLMTVAAEVKQIGLRVYGARDVTVANRFLRDEAELLRLTPSRDMPGKVDMQVNITGQVTLDESMPDWVCSNGIMDVLVKVGEDVRGVLTVLSEFAAERPGSP